MSPAKAYIFDQPAGKLRWKGRPDVAYAVQGGGSTLIPITTTEAPTVTPENTGLMGAALTPASWSTYQNASGQVIEYKDFTHDSLWGQLFGSNNIFRYCRWNGIDFSVQAAGNTFEHCEGSKITAGTGSNGFRLYDYKGIQTAGMDFLGVSGNPYDVLIERVYCVNTFRPGQSEHFDTLQVRGVDQMVLRDFIFDQNGSGQVGSPYNATIFLENAGNGNSNILIEQGRVKAHSLNNLYLFATGLRLHNLIIEQTVGVSDLYDPSWHNFQQTNLRRPDGTPVTL